MNEELITLLKDPRSNSSFCLKDAVYEDGRVRSGRLVSECGSVQIRDFIPRFIDDEMYAASFGYEWCHFKKTQLDSFTGTTISRDRWIDITGLQPEDLKGKVVVEAGCGAGRFLEVVAPHAKQAIGIDLSAAVEAARDNLLSRFKSISIVQADLNHLPLRNGSVDFIYSIGVLHHIPDTEGGIRSLVSRLKPGGEITVWLYGPRALSPLPLPADVYRFVGSRMRRSSLLSFLKSYVPFALRTHRLPGLGRVMKYLLPAPEYPRLPIPSHLRLEWSILDAFDRFATRIEKHFTEENLRAILNRAGLVNIKMGKVYNSLTGTKPEVVGLL